MILQAHCAGQISEMVSCIHAGPLLKIPDLQTKLAELLKQKIGHLPHCLQKRGIGPHPSARYWAMHGFSDSWIL